MLRKKLLNKKLNQSTENKVLFKLFVAVVVDDAAEAVCEALVDKDVVHKLFPKGFLVQALLLEVLSHAASAKLKLIKVKAVLKALVGQAGLWEALW